MHCQCCVNSKSQLTYQVDYSHANPFFLGWVVAAYSLGQLIASPIFGFWADKRPTREPLLVAMVINVVFSLLYCYCGAIPAGVAGYILIVARAMVGIGAGEQKFYLSLKIILEQCIKSLSIATASGL